MYQHYRMDALHKHDWRLIIKKANAGLHGK